MARTQIKGVQIKDDDITSADIADAAVRGATANGGTQREIATGTISDVDIRNAAITPLKIDSTQNFAMSTLSLGNGAVGAPSLFFTNSTTTGIYRVGADIMGFTTAGVLSLQIDATHHTDFLQHQAKQLVVHLLSADPGSPTEGQIWYNTTTHQWSGYNGTINVLLG